MARVGQEGDGGSAGPRAGPRMALLRKDSREQWVDIDSEDICQQGTHLIDVVDNSANTRTSCQATEKAKKASGRVGKGDTVEPAPAGR